jgi:predicted nucleic acid-binding protein
MAYLLDTNVLSETVKAQPDPQVVAWLEETPWERLTFRP